MQLRIGFSGPSSGCVIGLTLSGLTVTASVWMGSHTDAWHHLRAAGLSVSLDDDREFLFPAQQLTRLSDLPDGVRVEALGPLAAILPVVARPPGSAPAAVSTRPDGSLEIAHFDAQGMRHSAQLERPAVAALLASECPFVATPEAWETLEGVAGFPVTAADASLNHDGFIEIAAHRPQLVLGAPIPGLFRIDDTHFGAPVSSYRQIVETAGFRWTGRRPQPAPAPPPPARLSGQLSPAVAADVAPLAHQLAERHAAVVVYPPRSGRRLLAVAALESLDAYPALVVCPPRTLWVWQRHFDLVGRTHSASGVDAEVRILTYLDLASGARSADPAAIVFDDVCGSEAAAPRARAAAARLALFCDALRLGVADEWPEDPEEAVAVLELLRPAEFDVAAGLAWRYPRSPVQRCAEHTAAYLFCRDEPATPAGWLVQSVREVSVQPELLQAAAAATSVDEASEVVSAGTASTPSSKVAACLELVAAAVTQQRRVVVLTRHRRTATLLRAALAQHRPQMLTAADAGELAAASVAVCRWDTEPPDVRRFDVVVVCEWPASTAALDAAVGSPGDTVAAAEVVVLHSSGTVDDRLAAHAAAQRDAGVSSDAAARAALDPTWALSSRW